MLIITVCLQGKNLQAKLSWTSHFIIKHRPQPNFVFFLLWIESKIIIRKNINNVPFSFVFCFLFHQSLFPSPFSYQLPLPPSTLHPPVWMSEHPYADRVPFHAIFLYPLPSLSVGSLPYLPLFFSFHEKCHTPTRSSNAHFIFFDQTSP